jgi:DNA-binding XRE family transcriptional regulator
MMGEQAMADRSEEAVIDAAAAEIYCATALPPGPGGEVDVHPIRRLREEALMTREELAARAGVSLRTIWSIEHGRPCRAPTKRRILKALGVPKRRHHEFFPA